MSDALSQLIDAVRLRSVGARRFRPRSPWRLPITASAKGHFYVVTRGAVRIDVRGRSSALSVSAGETLLIAPRVAHVLSVGLDPPAAASRRRVAELPADEPVELVAGCMIYDAESGNSLVSALPATVHVPRGDGPHAAWLRATGRELAREVRRSEPGAAVVASRLADAVVVRALRAFLAALPDEYEGWLRALGDPSLSRALAAMHADPGRGFTVGELARRAGLSRTAFAVQFSAAVGKGPIEYLIAWRMQRAAHLLVRDGLAVGRVAEAVGYATATAFGRAFKRWSGLTPRAYVRSRRAA